MAGERDTSEHSEVCFNAVELVILRHYEGNNLQTWCIIAQERPPLYLYSYDDPDPTGCYGQFRIRTVCKVEYPFRHITGVTIKLFPRETSPLLAAHV